MSLVDKIKNQVKNSGANKGKLVYFKDGVKVRVRFLDDMDQGIAVAFHDSFAEGINVPCQQFMGRDCEYCENDDLRTRDQFIWSVWDYEAKEVKLIMAAVNNCSPVPSLVGMYDAYGTLLDRDYIISRIGKGMSTSYSVIPMDKVKFKNKKAKPFSEEKILKIIDKAFPTEHSDDDDDYEEKPKRKRNNKRKPKPVEDEDDWEDEEDDEEIDYEDMNVKELYKLCKERDIEVKPKKKKAYYIDLLEEYDEEYENEDEEDDWEDDDDKDDEEDEW